MANQSLARAISSFQCRRSRPGTHSRELHEEECYVPSVVQKNIDFLSHHFSGHLSNLTL